MAKDPAPRYAALALSPVPAPPAEIEPEVRLGGSDVSWAFIIAGLAGFALGSSFKPPALVVASFLVVLGLVPAVLNGTWSLLQGAGIVATLQGGYLGGLAVTLLWRRTLKPGPAGSEDHGIRRDP